MSIYVCLCVFCAIVGVFSLILLFLLFESARKEVDARIRAKENGRTEHAANVAKGRFALCVFCAFFAFCVATAFLYLEGKRVSAGQPMEYSEVEDGHYKLVAVYQEQYLILLSEMATGKRYCVIVGTVALASFDERAGEDLRIEKGETFFVKKVIFEKDT